MNIIRSCAPGYARAIEAEEFVGGDLKYAPLDERDKRALWYAVFCDKVHGFTYAYRVTDKSGVWVFLARSYVEPYARGAGLQRRFISVRERWARTIGAKGCYSYVERTNTHSANNLIACGYRIWIPDAEWALDNHGTPRNGGGYIYFRKTL